LTKPRPKGTIPALKRVLFVCTGNTCRSPLAEVIFRALAAKAEIEVASAGTFAMPGQPASRHSQGLAKERGLDLSGHRSRPLDEAEVQRADWVFAMSRNHLADVLDLCPEAEGKTFLVSHLSPSESLRGEDIADPFGGDLKDYRDMMHDLDLCLPALLDFIAKADA
jgi:protein-tyrosine-phosphatase